MDIKHRILLYFQLMRFHAGAQEALFPLLGSLVIGQRDLYLLIIIFIIGLLYHIFLHVLNDFADIEVDKKSDELKDKPLVSGAINKYNALMLAFITGFLTYILTSIYFHFTNAVIFLTLAVFFGTLYDLFGKEIPGISDLLMASSFTSSFFFGASAISANFTNLIYIIGGLVFIGILFANVVEGGLKDVDHDYLSGAKTIAIAMGVKVKKGKFLVTKKFQAFTYSILIISFSLLVLLLAQPEINYLDYNYLGIFFMSILVIAVIYTCYKLLNMKKFSRSNVKRLYFFINSGVGVLLFIALFPLLGIIITLVLLIFPISWYLIFNTILYGKPIQPKI